MAFHSTRYVDLTPERSRVSGDTGLQGSERAIFCSVPSLWPPTTSVVPSGGWPPSAAETGPEPAVCSLANTFLNHLIWTAQFSGYPSTAVASCGQLCPASSPAMDYVPDDSCPLKILETTRNTSYCWEIGSTKRDQRKATTFEEQANISRASFYWNRYIMRKCILRIPRHTFIF